MKVIDLAAPQAGDDEVLLKMEYVGFCGSDLSTFRGGNPMVHMPVVPGHEVGATIVSIGKNVPDGLKPGMTVTVNPYTNCGKCASCRNGRVNACLPLQGGFPIDFGVPEPVKEQKTAIALAKEQAAFCDGIFEIASPVYYAVSNLNRHYWSFWWD